MFPISCFIGRCTIILWVWAYTSCQWPFLLLFHSKHVTFVLIHPLRNMSSTIEEDTLDIFRTSLLQIRSCRGMQKGQFSSELYQVRSTFATFVNNFWCFPCSWYSDPTSKHPNVFTYISFEKCRGTYNNKFCRAHFRALPCLKSILHNSNFTLYYVIYKGLIKLLMLKWFLSSMKSGKLSVLACYLEIHVPGRSVLNDHA